MSSTATTFRAVSDELTRRVFWDMLTRRVIYVAATVAISLIVLIFVFLGREALPILTSEEVHREVTLRTLFLPQN